MQKTKIDSFDMTWNPVTGCMNDCPYCYARRIAERFGDAYDNELMVNRTYLPCDATGEMAHGVIHTPMMIAKFKKDDYTLRKAPYPMRFLPTFHEYRLEEPALELKPQNIFVCSMADLFGDWVPDEWIREVLQACAPQHRYLFLTKNPGRYADVLKRENHWYGITITRNEDFKRLDQAWIQLSLNNFLSIEPIMEPIDIKQALWKRRTLMTPLLHWGGVDCQGPPHLQTEELIKWVIVGAETGNRKERVVPEKSWIMDIKDACREAGIPLFMKKSIKHLMGPEFIQEYPW